MPLKPQSFTAADDLPTPREPVGHIRLHFGSDADGDDSPMLDLSACAWVGDALFVAGDEACSIERLVKGRHGWMTERASFPLGDFLDLHDPEEEIDIEGLALCDDWLWLTGSHARSRYDPTEDGNMPDTIDVEKFADLKDTRPRCVLARIPLVRDAAGLPLPVRKDGKRRAGMVAQKKDHGSKLGRYFARDRLIGPSMAMAAKEGGLDIEGLAVIDDTRVGLGMRGPVLQGFALIVELVTDPSKKGRLRLPSPPMKRLLDLAGLGIRDLVARGRDLYILAGPTQDVDGRCALYRWKDWSGQPADDETIVQVHRPEHLFDLPVKFRADHPEGIDFWTDDHGTERLMVIYDSPNPARIDTEKGTILADLFALD